jgi:cation-transporting ATPase 13A1
MRLEHPPTLASVGAYRNQPARRTFIAAVFVALYALTGSFVWQTIGDPYRAALIERDRLDAQTKANLTSGADGMDADGWVKPINAPSGASEIGKTGSSRADEQGVGAASQAPSAAGYDPFDDEQLFEDDEASATVRSGDRAAQAVAIQEAVTPARSALEFYTESSTDRLKLALPGVSDAEVAAAAGAEWQGMGGGQRSKWEKMAEADKSRYDRERKAALRAGSPSAEADKAKDELAELEAIEKKERPLPHEWLPSAGACVALFLLCTANALFYLMCRWSMNFRLRAFFTPSSSVEPGVYLCFKPEKHKGMPALARVGRSAKTGRLVCEFQRQRYEYFARGDEPPSEGEQEAAPPVADGCDGAVRLIRSPCALRVGSYTSSRGLASADEVALRAEQFGPNVLSVKTPRFVDLYIEQLLSPLVVFQIFCSVLWLLDAVSYGFTAFQVISILLLESTSVMQRQRTFKTLNSMSAKPFGVNVFRRGSWQKLSTTDILPGDLVSLLPPRKPTNASSLAAGAAAAPPPGPGAPPAEPINDVVPCDCLLLRGAAVVNEASLTGESVPQMKDRLTIRPGDAAAARRALELDGADRVHSLFAGTSIIAASQASAAGADTSNAGVPPTPDGGCLCFVLRTGFSSSQGELMQMIEFSQQAVSDDSRETIAALMLLFVFALISSAFVFKKGLEKGDRTTHELLLRCVIILTSVVPRHLPMQTAMAVNTALMALLKAGIFCTEPFRLPMAGKVDCVLFDKTGTLTSDKLVPVGILNAETAADRPPEQLPVLEASAEAAMVLAGCHSLVAIEGSKLVGDPIETAALEGIAWCYDARSQTSRPGDTESLEKVIAALQKRLEPPAALTPQQVSEGAAQPPRLTDAQGAAIRKELTAAQSALKAAQERRAKSRVSSVRIVHRHHFSSALQRMSTIAHVTERSSGGSSYRSLVKGSPEAVESLLRAGSVPAWYADVYRGLAERGMRVLALACKELDGAVGSDAQASALPRDEAESALTFAGFVAFACKTRADSPMVVGALLDSAHQVFMITGDAPLTALHVAREVHICSADKPALLLVSDGEGSSARWVRATGAAAETVATFAANEMRALSEKYELMATDVSIEAAAVADDCIWSELHNLRVFARMSPPGKAKVIRMLQEHNGHKVMMCGDGGNDCGALKQADVGLALLSGYGDTNTKGEGAEGGGGEPGNSAKSEEALNQQAKELARKSAESNRIQSHLLKAKQVELQAKQQEWLRQELAAAEARGEQLGVMGHMKIMKATLGRVQREMMEERRRLQMLHGNVFDKKASVEKLAAEMGESQSDLPMVRPGDASVAAPFTSRSPSVRNVVDLIRQGRCTLLSALQQQQIMMLESLISAYVLSALSLEGSRASERQMIASSWLLMIAQLAFSYASPIQKMHPQRPLRSLFHPAIFLSMFGQAALHLFAMRTAVQMARDEMGPEKLQEVVHFFKRERLRELKEEAKAASAEEGDYMAQAMALWTTPFMPNLLNTCVFLVETAQCIAVLLVNYKGRPWMKGISENHPLFLSVFACVAGCAVCAWGAFPQFNELIHLEPFPNDEFRWKLMSLVGVSILGTFLWDRLCVALFAPKIFRAMLDEALSSKPSDAIPALASLVKVLVVLLLLGTGNILLIGGAFYMYRKYQGQIALQTGGST